MAEEGFVQMYLRDFSHLAARAAAGQDVEEALNKRVSDAQRHAEIMDARKEAGHLEAVAERLKTESRRCDTRAMRLEGDPEAAFARREAFLLRCADMLGEQHSLA